MHIDKLEDFKRDEIGLKVNGKDWTNNLGK